MSNKCDPNGDRSALIIALLEAYDAAKAKEAGSAATHDAACKENERALRALKFDMIITEQAHDKLLAAIRAAEGT